MLGTFVDSYIHEVLDFYSQIDVVQESKNFVIFVGTGKADGLSCIDLEVHCL